MLKKTITYTDYNGFKRTEDFYFNLSKAEIMEMELSTTGGFGDMIQKIVAAQDTPGIIKIFKDVILKARFIKSDEIREAFSQTEAYSELFMELSTNDVAAADFVNGIVPGDMVDEIKRKDLNPPMLTEHE